MLFNEKLKMLRKGKGLTQEDLAEKINVSRQAITKWESGEGIPDIENLKQISILFDVTIDELVKENFDVKIDNSKNIYVKELVIDHSKDFDIKISKIDELTILNNSEEKVKIEILSNTDINLEDAFIIKLDELYNKLDINVKEKINVDNVTINLYLPEKYIDEIELNSKIKKMNINNLTIDKLEYDGSLKYLNVENSKGNIVLNTSKSDVEVNYDKFEGSLEVNLINSTARVSFPTNTEYKTILKGIKNKFIDSKDFEDSNNTIELNGINSKLIIIEK